MNTIIIEDCMKLKELIKMDGSPVGITYYDVLPNDKYNVDEQVVCQSIQDARYGKEMAVCAENSKCRGGSYFLGLIDKPPYAHKFWTEIEMAYANRCISMSISRHNPEPPTSLSKYVSMCPIEKCERVPDLVSFVCQAEQAARLLGLNAFQNGHPPKIYSYAAACAAAIAIPMTTGELHVSFIDNSARTIADFKSGELIVTIPAHQISGIANSITECIWGTADAPYLKEEAMLKGVWKLKKQD
ncbi:MAG: DUF169 domain-containing protein [Bacillota bacterium]|nr:DUF169 domain-containing protein [Bacillota bacterium]